VSGGGQLVERLQRLLLRLYPREFRARWGEDVLQVLRSERAARAGASPVRRWREGAGALLDLACGGVAERARSAWRRLRGRDDETPAGAARRQARRRRRPAMEGLWRDFRQAGRTFVRNPVFVAVAVLTIALGVGANTAIFSVVRAVLLRPLPYDDPQELVLVWGELTTRNVQRFPMSPPDLQRMRAETRSFERLEAVVTFGQALTAADVEPERIETGLTTPGFLDMLGARAALGRLFVEDDATPPPPNTAPEDFPPSMVVLSDGLWRRRFGGDPGVVGRTVQLNGQPATVVGVAEAGFTLYMPPAAGLADPVDAWVAGRFDFVNAPRNNVFLRVVGRLEDGVTVAQAQVEVDALYDRIRAEDARAAASGWRADVMLLHDDLTREARPIVLALLGAVGFVLLIACANVSNLLLVRASSREREMAVRAALGGSRGRLIREGLAESLVLAVAGAALGTALAAGGIRLLLALQPEDIPRLATVRIDGAVLGYTALAALVAALLFGMLPALQSSRADLSRALRDRGVSSGARRQGALRSAVVVLEVALSLVLLIGTGLMLRSFEALRNVDPGFEPEGVLTFSVPLANARYPTTEHRWTFGRQLRERLASIPGVQSVAAAFPLPLAGEVMNGPYGPMEAAADPDLFLQADIRIVTPGYFEAMGTRLVAGRLFTEPDMADSMAIAIVDRTLAETIWPGENAVGRQMMMRYWTPEPMAVEVIGVVEHQRNGSLAEEGRATVYYLDRVVGGLGTLSYVVRTAGDPSSLVAAVRRELAGLDPLLPMADVRPMTAYVQDAIGGTRFALVLTGVFSATALVLASIGLYGVLAFAVRQRTAEIGIRRAFGASTRTILRMVVGQGLALALGGVVAGLLAALALTRVLESQLVGVAATDPATFAAVAAIFLVIATLACAIPALRAARVDPLVALRED
jgi:putative ABC transport system permease protein